METPSTALLTARREGLHTDFVTHWWRGFWSTWPVAFPTALVVASWGDAGTTTDGYRRLTLGSFEVTALYDGEVKAALPECPSDRRPCSGARAKTASASGSICSARAPNGLAVQPVPDGVALSVRAAIRQSGRLQTVATGSFPAEREYGC